MKSRSIIALFAILLAGAGIVGSAVYAQNKTQASATTSSDATDTSVSAQKVSSPADTDNIQDPSGIEVPDAPASEVKDNDKETNDDQVGQNQEDNNKGVDIETNDEATN